MTFFKFEKGVPPLGSGGWVKKKFHPPPRVGQPQKSWEFVLSDVSVQNPTFSSHLRTPTESRYGHPIRMYSQNSLYRRLWPKKTPFFRLQTIVGHTLTIWVSAKASKMPYFERPDPKIPTPIFFLDGRKNFLGGQKFKAVLECSRGTPLFKFEKRHIYMVRSQNRRGVFFLGLGSREIE